MSGPPHGRRSRRLANQPPLPGELPQPRRPRAQQNAQSRSLSAAGAAAGRSSSQVSTPRQSAASASENTPIPDTGSFYFPPTEPSATSPPESPPPPGPGQIARMELRDLHIFDSQATAVEIGGLHVTRGITNNLLYDMTALIIEAQSTWSLRGEQNQLVPRDDNQVLPGNYYLDSDAPISVTHESALTRTVTELSQATRVRAFQENVRLRDRGCVVSKIRNSEINIQAGFWAAFEACHVFPLAYGGIWTQLGLSQYITVPEAGGDNINSVQNGILLRPTLHVLFDLYMFSISPDHGYKVICFSPDDENIAGTYLDPSFISDPRRPPDELLNWHFRQAVLNNMKGMGEPSFEHDFPPGSDMIGQILKGPKPESRMEFELFTKLGHLTERENQFSTKNGIDA